MSEPSAPSVGPGARLLAARQQRGLSLDILASQLKVSVGRLEALEGERWDRLPDPTHARALATSVCRVLDLDPAPVLAAMPRAGGPALERVSAGLNQPVREGDVWHSTRLGWLGLAVLLLVLALGLALWPRGEGGWRFGDAWMPAWLGAHRETTTDIVAPPAPAPELATASAPSSSGILAASAVPQPVPAPMGVSSGLASAPDTPPTGLGAATEWPVLTVRAERGASWVSVTDAKGTSLVARLLQQGESLELPGEPPLRVTLGNAPVLSLQWRGQGQALEGYEGTRVARLELK